MKKGNKIIFFTFSAFIIFIINGCIKTTYNIDVPESKPKLVIQSYISPQDSQIVVRVSKSVPVFGKNSGDGPEIVDDATVIISGGSTSTSVQLNYDPIRKYYFADTITFKIQGGETYYLTVTAPGGFKVDASCTVPVAVNNTLEILPFDSLDSIEYGQTHESINGHDTVYYEYRWFIKFQFHDTPNQTDFYSIFLYELYNDPYNGLSSQISFHTVGSDNMGSDNNKDGSIFHFSPIVRKDDDYSYKLYFLTTDEYYYKYHFSFFKYSNSGLFSEPSSIYTNINNGLGVFAGYQQVVVELSF